jgi:hypothetical protein
MKECKRVRIRREKDKKKREVLENYIYDLIRYLGVGKPPIASISKTYSWWKDERI